MAVYPNAEELCDGQYNDCTDINFSFGTPPALESDDDGDTFVECNYDANSWVGSSHVTGGLDCDDSDPSRNSSATEIWYDGVDSDCSGGSDFDQDGDGEDSDQYGRR